jgi:formylglycine-generating enzyme required for sulfatase activity
LTRDEAIELLGFPDANDGVAVDLAHTREQTAVTRRIEAAPTPELRAKYQEMAERLRQARDLLRQETARVATVNLSLTQQGDLPIRTPLHTGNSGRTEALNPSQTLATRRILADRYEIRTLLGTGGMGQVFAAFDRVRKEEVAIKVLQPHFSADPKACDRFLNEAKIASSLSHPNIVRVFDVHQTEHFTFLTMERLKGHDLRHEITRRTQNAERFQPEEVCAIAGPLCEALQYAHKYTIHRDVKPENIWMDEDGTVKLMDFGIARLLRASQITAPGIGLGTAYYMAPEQLRGLEIDHRADQFALGVVLYELLTGQIPQGAIESPIQIRRSIPVGLSDAVMKAMASDPQKRHSDMAALRRELSSKADRGIKASRRMGVVVAVAFVLCAAIAYPFWKSTQQPRSDPGLGTEEKPAKIPDSEKLAPVVKSEKMITNSIGMKLALIPSGEFMMGSPDDEKGANADEKPRHQVRITKPFYLGVTEVTQSQYKKVIEKNPSYFSSSGVGKVAVAGQNTSQYPVENVSWEDAVEFCRRLSELSEEHAQGHEYRLPTEAEWEYACRAGSTTGYQFGDDVAGPDEYAWTDLNSANRPHPVGGKRANAFGLFDMNGNVWEWCSDWYVDQYYVGLPGPVLFFVSARLGTGFAFQFLLLDGRRSSKTMAKWFNAAFQPLIGIVQRRDAS